MQESDLLKLYSLALQLVPDPDVAGDLFMATGDAAALLRRANRWRQRQGLPPLEALPDPRPLSPAEAGHALHLASRSRLRRRLRGVGALLATAGLVAAALLWKLPDTPPEGLAASPVFQAEPLRQFRHPDGYQVRIHRIEADPGAVHLFWSAVGPGARAAADALEPALLLNPAAARWLTPSETAVTASRADRLVGRSTFETIVTVEQEAWVGFGNERAGRPEFLVRLPLARRPDETARTVPLDRVIAAGPVSIHLRSLVLGRNYTQVRYSTNVEAAGAPALYSLDAGGLRLVRKGPIAVSADGLAEATFPAMPPEADRIFLTFTPVVSFLPPRTYPLPGPAEVYTRSGSTATVVLALEDRSWAGDAHAYFTDAGGQRYPAVLSFQIEGDPPHHRVMARTEQAPPDVTLVSLTLTGLRQYYRFEQIEVELAAGRP